MRFAVFTHVIHQQEGDAYFAYSPYVKEMNLWFKHVKMVEVVAPRIPISPNIRRESFIGEAYKHSRLSFKAIPSFHLLNFRGILDSLLKIPFIFFKIIGTMRRADHFHLRCP